MEIFPTAKVVLTVRDPKKWYKSAYFIHSVLITLSYNWPYSWFVSLAGSNMLCAYTQKQSGGIQPGKGKFPHVVNGKMNKALSMGEKASVDFFNNHTDDVCSHVPASKLLVFEVQEGWEPLCKFLDIPVPDTPFPKINDSNEVKFVFNCIRVVAWVAILGVSALLSCALFYCPNYTYLSLVFG
jgi:hypothetical protein